MVNLNELSLDQLMALRDMKLQEEKGSNSLLNTANALLTGFGKAVSLGAMPKIQAAIDVPFQKALNPSQPVGDIYKKLRDFYRQKELETTKYRPKTTLVGDVLGSILLPFPAKTIKGAATLAGLYGGARGANELDEASIQEKALSAVVNAVPSALIGGAAQGLVNKFLTPKGKVPLEMTERMNLAKEYGVPLSEGEVTLRPDTLMHEASAEQGLAGDTNTLIMQQLRKEQEKSFKEATNRSLLKVGKEHFIEKGAHIEPVMDSFAKKVIKEAEPTTEAYNKAKAAIGRVDIREIEKFPQYARNYLQSPDRGFSSANAPKTYSQIKAFEQLFFKEPKNAKDIVAADVRGLETWRQGLNQALSKIESNQERNALNTLKHTFDNWMDDIIETSLIEGDTHVLELFKNARKIKTDYMQKYFGNNRKDVGKNFIRKLVEDTKEGIYISPEEMANKLFGMEEMGFKRETASILRELKKHLSVPEMDSLRLEGAAKLVSPLLKSGQKGGTYINNLEKFGQKHPTLVKDFIGQSTFDELKDLGKVWHQTFGRPLPSKLQPSKTSYLLKYFKSKPFIAGLMNKKVTTDLAAIKQNIIKNSEMSRPMGIIPKAITFGMMPANQDINQRLNRLSLQELEQLKSLKEKALQ